MSAIANRLPMKVVARLLGLPDGGVGYVLECFEKPSATGEYSLIAHLAERYASGEAERLTALGIMTTLFSAAGESTASLLDSVAWILTDRPAIQRQLRENPELVSAFIEQTLRFEAPFRGHYRHARHDSTLAGVDVPAHIVLRMPLQRTTWIKVVDVGAWLPSILVRRRERLSLAVR